MSTQEQRDLHICPVCGTANELDELVKREYRCSHCKLELAYLDVAANGVIRGIFGWLRNVGDIIGDRYQVKSVLGKGGFGATYLVDDLRLSGKRRAIKEIPELLFDEYETTLLSRLNHPSIPDIIDRSIVDGMVYLVLEFGGSHTLGGERKRYLEGRIPLAKLLPWTLQLSEVLIYLHSQDPPIIHRDLKPDNVLLDETGRIMLIDFGIAKESTPTSMTRTLGRAVTHGFSPPEQAMGTGTDERSDIYALAATFYALLTGVSPPAAHERVAGKEIVPPSQIIADIPPQLEEVIMQALSLNVNHRQQTMKEFSEALERISPSAHEFVSHTTEYAERTVMVGRPSVPSGSQPRSLKVPSSKTKTGSFTPVATAAEPASKKRIYWVAAILIVIALILVWIFWPPPPVPPSAQLNTNVTQGTAPLTVNFDGSASSDQDGEITDYQWNFGDGETGSGKQIQHVYKNAGSFTAKLTVTDDDGANDTTSVMINVNPPSPPPAEPAKPGSATDWLKKRQPDEVVPPEPIEPKPAKKIKRPKDITQPPKQPKPPPKWTIIPKGTHRSD